MNNTIDFFGIETNNLKNIDVTLNKHSINIIIGPSGSGKSSLAYDTIAKIGEQEYNSMFSDIPTETDYKIRSYSNLVAIIPLKQTNSNNNVRSTIGTYFNINQCASIIFSVLLDIPNDFFVLNKEENLCSECHGLGYLKKLDLNRLINYDLPLEKCPVKCWKKYKDFYSEIIKCFCNDNKIDYTKNFRQLSDAEKKCFLYGDSEKKYSIKYKKVGMFSRRTTKFFGVMTNNPMIANFAPSNDFFSEVTCPICKGEKYSQVHRKEKILEFSIGQFMCTPFYRLSSWLESVQKIQKTEILNFQITKIIKFVNKSVELNLGHLFFNRTIPSLSGGELQRLRLVQVFNTQLSDLLIVLDEPLAGLSKTEKSAVYNNIKDLAKKHTMLIIDHHDIFHEEASKIIALGEKSGKYGGSIIDSKAYIENQKINENFICEKEEKIEYVSIINKIYNYSGVDLGIAMQKMNIIIGNSGVGKSTLLREYFPQFFDNYSYISQKNLSANIYSSVVTVLEIYNLIISDFAKQFNKDKNYFSNQKGCEGSCQKCSGYGYQTYGNEFQEKIQVICKECEGTGFNKILKKYKIDNLTIFDIWKMTIEESYTYYKKSNSKIAAVLTNAKEILLSHLQLGQKAETLSGGENIRVKILKSLKDTSLIYGIDEPFRGLSNSEIFSMIIFFNKFITQKKTIIIVDHEEESFKYFSRQIVLKNNNSLLVGEKY